MSSIEAAQRQFVCSVFNGSMDSYRPGVTGSAYNNVMELKGPVEKAYPHMTGLNVRRSGQNAEKGVDSANPVCYIKNSLRQMNHFLKTVMGRSTERRSLQKAAGG